MDRRSLSSLIHKILEEWSKGQTAHAATEAAEAMMAVCAIRYCLGRQSYIVSDGQRWAREYGRKYPVLRRIVTCDIESEIRAGRLMGAALDDAGWRAVLSDLKAMGET